MNAAADSYEEGDVELILRYREGDISASLQLYERHHDDAITYASRLLRSRERGEDIASEAFVKVIEVIRRGKGPNDDFKLYQRAVVRNLVNDFFRDKQRLVDVESPEDYSDEIVDDASVSFEIDNSDIIAAFKKLPTRWQQALYSRIVDNTKIPDIAQRFDLSSASMSGLIYRARIGLRSNYLQQLSTKRAAKACIPFRDMLVKSVLDTLSPARQHRLAKHLSGCSDCVEMREHLQLVSARFERVERATEVLLVVGIVGAPGLPNYIGGLYGKAAAALGSVSSKVVIAGGILLLAAAAAAIIAVNALSSDGSDQPSAPALPEATQPTKSSPLSTPAPVGADCVTTAVADTPAEGETTVKVRNDGGTSCQVVIEMVDGEVLVDATIVSTETFVMTRDGEYRITVTTPTDSYSQTF